MSDVDSNVTHARRRSRQRGFWPYAENNEEDDEVIVEQSHNSESSGLRGWIFLLARGVLSVLRNMHKSTRTGLIGIAILVCMVVVILFLNLQIIQPDPGAIFCVSLDGGPVCHSNDSAPYRYYGTKTAYHIAVPNVTEEEFKVEGCKPKLFYLLNRHATRYPDAEDIDEMIERLPILKQQILNASSENKVNICEMDIKKLESWEITLVPENDNKLSSTGEEESIELAQRYKKKFPSILNKVYSSEDFAFEYTSKERTRSTAESFAKGLFGDSGSSSINFDNKTSDKVLKFHKECKNLQRRCKESPVNIEEINKFEDGIFMKTLKESISKRLGFKVSYDDIEVMYRACVFSYSLGKSDVWCSVFSQDDLKVLEYEGDLDDYYKDAYGNQLSFEQACPVVDYIINLFKLSINETSTKSVFHFSHAGAIKKVIARFGLFKDTQSLSAEGMCFHDDRQWRSSLICPFNSNLAFVLFQCELEHKVTVFHNEQPVVVEGCSKTLCPIDDFFIRYEPVAEKCDIKDLCCSCCSV